VIHLNRVFRMLVVAVLAACGVHAAGLVWAQAAAQPAASASPISDDLIRAYLAERDRLQSRQAAVAAQREEAEARMRAITAQKQERYNVCTTRLSECKSDCTKQGIADALSSIGPGGTIDYSRQMAASSNQRDCESSCEIQYECESLRP